MLGHEVRLMPPQYVKPYVKTNRNDALDDEAICEAVRRPTMRFVPIKTVDQQAILSVHRAREQLVRTRIDSFPVRSWVHVLKCLEPFEPHSEQGTRPARCFFCPAVSSSVSE